MSALKAKPPRTNPINQGKNSPTTTHQSVHPFLIRELVFKAEHSLAWDVLDSESLIYTETDVNLDKITHLTTLYMVLPITSRR